MNWPDKIENILVSLNGGQNGYKKVFAAALALAKTVKARIWLFHFQEGAMIGQPNMSGPVAGGAQADWMLSLINEAAGQQVATAMLVAQGPGRATLMSAIDDCRADLIVLGRTDRGLVGDAVSGLSSYVLHNAPPRASVFFVSIAEGEE